MNTTAEHDKRMATLTLGKVYPLYVTKIQKKGRSIDELQQIIEWLTGYTSSQLTDMIKKDISFETFFEKANLNPKANLITGMICGYRIEEITNQLTKKIRYLDKLVDELAKGKKIEKILRS
jgi:hypothetical protein